jgi:hypothetical protein
MGNLENFHGIKIKSDGTPQGTYITTTDGAPINTVTKFSVVMDANAPAGRMCRCILECFLPELEMEIPPEHVDYVPGSLKQCPKCSKELKPEMVMRSSPMAPDIPTARYTCKPCDYEQEYEFKLDMDSDRPDQAAIAEAIKEVEKDGGK